MRIKLKFPRVLDGKLCVAHAEHEVSDELKKHWFFQHMVDKKEVVILDEPVQADADEKSEDEKPKAKLKGRG